LARLGRLIAEIGSDIPQLGLSHHRRPRRGHTAMVAIWIWNAAQS